MTSQIKRCAACQGVKLLADFNRHPNSRDRRQPICRACESSTWHSRRHGMTRADKARIALDQGGCAVCGTTDPGRHSWVVDHDHRCCGPIKSCEKCRRGILCHFCNTALGMARDDPARLRALADYLDRHRAVRPDQLTDQSTDSLSRVTCRNPTNVTDGLTETRWTP